LSAGSEVGSGDAVELEVDSARIHIFDHDTGARIG
jgi:hypothetical protein